MRSPLYSTMVAPLRMPRAANTPLPWMADLRTTKRGLALDGLALADEALSSTALRSLDLDCGDFRTPPTDFLVLIAGAMIPESRVACNHPNVSVRLALRRNGRIRVLPQRFAHLRAHPRRLPALGHVFMHARGVDRVADHVRAAVPAHDDAQRARMKVAHRRHEGHAAHAGHVVVGDDHVH